jgi:hypothetical protein
MVTVRPTTAATVAVAPPRPGCAHAVASTARNAATSAAGSAAFSATEPQAPGAGGGARACAAGGVTQSAGYD